MPESGHSDGCITKSCQTGCARNSPTVGPLRVGSALVCFKAAVRRCHVIPQLVATPPDDQ
jgi:hypothetical protein